MGQGTGTMRETAPLRRVARGARDGATGAGTSLPGLSTLLPLSVSPPRHPPHPCVSLGAPAQGARCWLAGEPRGGKGPVLPTPKPRATAPSAVAGRQIEKNRPALPVHPAPLILLGDKTYPDGSERVGCLSPPISPWYLLLAAAGGQSFLLPLSTMEGFLPHPCQAVGDARCPCHHPGGHPQPPAQGGMGTLHVPGGCAGCECEHPHGAPVVTECACPRAWECVRPRARVPKCLCLCLVLARAAPSPCCPPCAPGAVPARGHPAEAGGSLQRHPLPPWSHGTEPGRSVPCPGAGGTPVSAPVPSPSARPEGASPHGAGPLQSASGSWPSWGCAPPPLVSQRRARRLP